MKNNVFQNIAKTLLRRILLLLSIISLYSFLLNAQADSKNVINSNYIDNKCLDQFREDVYLHLSRWSIVAGERLYFKAYILGKNIIVQNSSKVLYIEILDEHNKLKANYRSNIDSGICISSISIPDSLKTGLYKILAYTNLMRNFPASSIIPSSIIIIGMRNNPAHIATSSLSPDSISKTTNEPDQNISQNRNPALLLNGSLDKKGYNKREKVALNLNFKDADGNPLIGSYSVSVFEKLPENYSNLNHDISIVNSILTSDATANIKLSNNELKEFMLRKSKYIEWLEKVKKESITFPFKTENRSYLLEGVLRDKSSQKVVPGKIIFLSTPDSLANLKYSVTDSLGRFIFALDRRYDNRKVFLNIQENSDSKECIYVLDNKQLIDSLNSSDNLALDSLMNEYILKSKKIALINKVYHKYESMRLLSLPINRYNHFYGNPDYSIRLSDYTELDDFNDICKNILPEIAFRKKNDNYEIYSGTVLFQRFPNQNCLVMLNNIPFYNYNYLSTLGSRQIDQIDVKYNYSVYGNLNLPGILSIYTKDKIIISNKNSIIFDNKVESISFNNETNTNDVEKTPVFKQLLYWNPELVFDINGQAKLEFNTTDLKTEYYIDIEGLTNKGIPVSKRFLFKVQ
jgi:hypothetical protein